MITRARKQIKRKTRRPRKARAPRKPKPTTGQLLDASDIQAVIIESKTAANMLGLGCVPEATVQDAIKRGYELMVKSAKPMEWAAILKAFTAAAKLNTDAQPKRHVHALESPEPSFSQIEADLGID